MASVAHSTTVEEYVKMGETGILDASRRYELIAGRVYDVSPQNDPHANSVSSLNEILSSQPGRTYSVRVQVPLVIGDRSMPEPDVALVTGIPWGRHARADDTLAVIEVADSSLAIDTGIKARVYADAGIGHYLVVDLRSRRILVSSPAGSAPREYSDGQEIELDLPPPIRIRVSDVLGPMP